MPFNPRAKRLTGRVVSDKMDKTVVVAVESMHRHPLYNECRAGDTVRLVESRPLSKEKRWRVIEIQRHDERASLPPVSATVPVAPQDLE